MIGAQANFVTLAESTKADWDIVKQHWLPWLEDLPGRVLAHLAMLADDHGGFPVSRLEHSLQTATRAHRDGRDEDYVICALLHDIGDALAPANHAEFAADILKPYVSEANHWMIAHHGSFQLTYHASHWGLDPDAREQFRDHENFGRTVEFCERYDQVSFDRAYASLPLAFFAPLVGRVFSVKRLAERAAS